MFVLDMHVHSDHSSDAKPTAEEYAEWVLELKDEYSIHGFVLTEHRYYSIIRNGLLADLAKKTGLVILQGVELESDYGHLLAYGVTPHFLDRVDVTKRLKGQDVCRAALETGTAIVPAHPTRHMLGAGAAVSGLEGVRAIEVLNGASERSENKMSETIAKNNCFWGTGGSDAHFIAEFGSCMTRFERPLTNDRQLVEELLKGDYRPVFLEETRHT